jgi:hypothetical protein
MRPMIQRGKVMRARLLGLLGFLALLGHDAVAQTVVVTGARITWYGKFVLGRAKRERVPGGANEVSVQASKVKPPMVNSDQVPLAPDAMFGFGYVLAGEPADAHVKLRYVIKIPPPGAVDAATGHAKLTDEGSFSDLRLGRGDLFIGESLADFKNPPAGIWTIQLWYGERMLLEKNFTLAK